jgi:catalase
MPDGAVGPGLILVDAEGADEGIASFIAAMGAFRHFAHENAPPKV